MKKILLFGFIIIISSMMVLASGSVFHDDTVFDNIKQNDDGYIKTEDGYISAGLGNRLNFATNTYYSNGGWVFPDSTAGGMFHINENNDFVYFTHDGAGTFTQRFGYDTSEGTFNVLGKLTTNDDAGIGTSTPLAKLHILQSVNNNLGGILLQATTGNNLRIWHDTVNPIFTVDTTDVIKLSTSDILMPTVYSSTVGATNRDLYIDNTGKIGYVSSSLRYKENIRDYDNISYIYNLRPVVFDYKKKESGINKIGLIAEEVEKVNPYFVSYNEENNPETVNYGDFVVPLIKTVQEQNKRIKYLENNNNEYITIIGNGNTNTYINYDNYVNIPIYNNSSYNTVVIGGLPKNKDDYYISITPVKSFCGEYYVNLENAKNRGDISIVTEKECSFNFEIKYKNTLYLEYQTTNNAIDYISNNE